VTERRSSMLSGIVRGILADAPALRLLGEVTGDRPRSADLDRTAAHAVIWIVDDPNRADAYAILEGHPEVQIVTVESDGQHGSVWRMRPSREPLGELSPERLIEALSDPAKEACA
jgi:hypothetical protein